MLRRRRRGARLRRGGFHLRSIASTARACPQTRTKVMLIVGDPSRAFACRASRTPASGWRARNSSSRITSASIRWRWRGIRSSKDPQAVQAIAATESAPKTPREFFVRRFSEGVARIAAAFYPKPVIVRTSDFKTNEYAQLLGGERVRARRRESDDRIPRRVALLRRAVRRRVRARVRGAAAGAATNSG